MISGNEWSRLTYMGSILSLYSIWTHDWRLLSDFVMLEGIYFYLLRKDSKTIEDWESSQCLKTRGAVVVNIMDKCLFLLHFSCIQWQVQIYLGFKVLQGNCNTIFGIANCFLLIRVSGTQTNRQDWRSI